MQQGSSIAAPQVAGLAAYYLSLPDTKVHKGEVAMQVKDALVKWKRSPHLGSPDVQGCATNWEEEVFCPSPQPFSRFHLNEQGNETYSALSNNKTLGQISSRSRSTTITKTSFHSIYRHGRWFFPQWRNRVSNSFSQEGGAHSIQCSVFTVH